MHAETLALLTKPLYFPNVKCVSASFLRPAPNHLVPVFSCEKVLNIKKIKIKIEGLGLGCLSTIYYRL
jgi:hypothetical protein